MYWRTSALINVLITFGLSTSWALSKRAEATVLHNQAQLDNQFRSIALSNRELGVESQANIDLNKTNFSDIRNHWAETEINSLYSQRIVSGYPNGNFKPNAPVNRAEFATVIDKAFSNRTRGRNARGFLDTTSHWANNHIQNASALGFMSGYRDGNFRPGSNIKRVEAMVALASGLNLRGSTPLGNFYRDANQVCGSAASYSWACSQISAATNSGIRIKGPNSNWFKPSQQASRADIAVFIHQALQIGGGATPRISQATPSAGVLTRVDSIGGTITLRGRAAARYDQMRVPSDRLRVPARSGANIGFRPSNGSGTIPNFLVQAGSPRTRTEYWYPCNGHTGKFVMGWSAGSNTPTCSRVELGQTFRIPTRASKSTSVLDIRNRGIRAQIDGLPNDPEFTEEDIPMIIAPATSEPTWALVEVTDYSVDVKVLRGEVLVGPENLYPDLERVYAGDRYQLEWDEFEFQEVIYDGPLSAAERSEIANSTDIATFQNPNSWSPDIASQLSAYQLFQDTGIADTSDPIQVERISVNGISIWKTEIDLSNPNVLFTAVPESEINAAGGLRNFARQRKPAVILSGSFEDPNKTNWTTISEGQFIEGEASINWSTYTVLGLDRNNTAEIIDRINGPSWSNYRFAITGHPRLVNAGVAGVTQVAPGATIDIEIPRGRAAIGISRSTQKLYHVITNQNISLSQFAEIMQAIGAEDVVNLEGGGGRFLVEDEQVHHSGEVRAPAIVVYDVQSPPN